ncbi:hypothetical protein IFM89_037223 [Coptis chinensis]|uniref:Uncharacterized protein n=1 Tax=Coptis chinensis TaxID=261450 RepID=A0A835HDZ3_9MAGN|nr:hypothetical protein IFM89_037223 [Coptis chinensis]
MNRSLKSATFLLRSALLSHSSKSFSADALVPEYSRGEIGCVSGIPDEHLRRKETNDGRADAWAGVEQTPQF